MKKHAIYCSNKAAATNVYSKKKTLIAIWILQFLTQFHCSYVAYRPTVVYNSGQVKILALQKKGRLSRRPQCYKQAALVLLVFWRPAVSGWIYHRYWLTVI